MLANYEIQSKIKEQIQSEISQLANEKKIRVLYACESGSRAWGFASPDSDYDVRIIYLHATEWYLSVLPKDENFDIFADNDLDINGWDIRKVLRLMLKSNATPYEWMQSPIGYVLDEEFKASLWSLGQHYFQPRSIMHHYLGLAQNAFRKGIVTEFEINIKKYFYVLRPLFAARWVAEKGTVPPMTFADLMPVLDPFPAIKQLVTDLWRQKLNAAEGDTVTIIPQLLDFIDTQIERCFSIADATELKPTNPDMLDAFFRTIVKTYNHR